MCLVIRSMRVAMLCTARLVGIFCFPGCRVPLAGTLALLGGQHDTAMLKYRQGARKNAADRFERRLRRCAPCVVYSAVELLEEVLRLGREFRCNGMRMQTRSEPATQCAQRGEVAAVPRESRVRREEVA